MCSFAGIKKRKRRSEPLYPKMSEDDGGKGCVCFFGMVCAAVVLGVHLLPFAAAGMTCAVMFTSSGIQLLPDGDAIVRVDAGLFKNCVYTRASPSDPWEGTSCSWNAGCSVPFPGRAPLDLHCGTIVTLRLCAVLCTCLDIAGLVLWGFCDSQKRINGGRMLLFVRLLYVVFCVVLAHGLREGLDGGISWSPAPLGRAWFWLACLSLLWVPIWLKLCWKPTHGPIDSYDRLWA